MKKIALSLMLSIFMINGQAQTFHYPVGTKWTEIRLDTLKYDSWYSRVGDEWVPNFETVEYYVKGYYRSDPSQDEPFMSVFTDGPEWTDSLTLLLDQQGNAVLATVLNNYRMAFTLAYEFDWQVGDEPYYQELLGANTTAFPPVGLHKFGTIEEIKEGNFGGEKPLKYVDLDGVRIIQGIGVTTWNDGECLFGPVKPYEALSFFKQNTGQESQSATRHYRSMLVHFERNGEILYDVWPEKEDGSSQSQGYKVIVDGLKFYLSEETHEAIIDSYNTWAGELVLPSSINYDGQGYIVKGISWCAFYNCKELTRVRIPKTIENVIHYDLSNEYPSNVSPDYMNPFVGCTSLVSIEVDEDNPIMSSKEGVMFSKDGTKLYAYPAGNKQENYAVPQGVTYIGGASFSYSADLVSVELPETVERMCSAFKECRNLKKINLPKKLAYLDASTFRNCSSLESIDIPNGVRGIGEQTFSGCVSMETIDMPESIQTIGSLAFRECKLDALIIRGILENQTMNHSLFSGLDESTKLYVPTSEIERYKKIYAGPILPLDSYSGSTETIEDPQELEYYPEGTKWTEIRLDTLKYDSWYSKVGDEWVPNYEMVEYYVKGEIKNNCLVGEGFPDYFRCIYSDGPTWSDSLTFLLMESKYGVQATIPLFEEDMLMLIPGTAYTFGKWETGQKVGFRTISGANIPSIPAVGYGSYGTIQEIKEGYWGGTHSLKCAYLDNGRQVIHGIGVTAWNGETCLLGAIIYGIYEPQHYRSMLVHFERDGEVLYHVWPEKSDNSVAINEENFPDEYFRQYLLSKDYGQDGILTAEELKGIKTLILNFDKAEEAAADQMPKIPLRSLKGLEFFTELEVLNCNDCLLTELNLTCNNKLKELECAGNKLTELDLSQNRELRSINCSLNNLEDLDITNNEALTSFVGMHNPFHSALDFSHQHNLKTLYVAFCNLNSLDLSQNPELTTLSCIGNDLTYLDLSHNPKLIELYCGDNHGLTEINLKNCPKLRLVLCDECQLKALDLSQCLDLKRVSCINNQLESLILNPDAEVQNSLYILGNRLSEQAMLDFINSLHPNTTSDPSRYRLYAMGSADKEKNECTEKVIKAAYERGWTIFDSTGKIYTATEVKDYAYRPFVEEGKTWTLCCLKDGADPTEKIPGRIEYQYLQGDTLIGGLRYKRWWIDMGENVPPQYAGAAREENLVVYFCPPGMTESQVIYDFSSPVGTIGWYNNFYSDLAVIYDVTLGENRIINTETYKGWCRDISFNGTTVTWLQGVGYMGLVNLPFGGYILLSCTVGNEVLYYDASLMQSDAEVKKKKLDFTHVIKAQPRAPRHRIQQQDGDMQQDGETLQGEYSDTELFVRLNPLAGYYTATLTDASGRAVYQKTLLTDNVLALSTELTGYAPGDYVLTLENHEEVYTATLSIEPNGIEKVQESKFKVQGSKFKVQGLFDLQGRRLQKAPEKGIYIQDGKKVLK